MEIGRLLNTYQVRRCDAGVMKYIPGYRESFAASAAIYSKIQHIMVRMAQAIEADIGRQFEAYEAKGMEGIDSLIAGGHMQPFQRLTWAQIDRGEVRSGTESLTLREQTKILNPGYTELNNIPGVGIVMSLLATSGFNECPSYATTTLWRGSFADTRVGPENSRFSYIRDHVLSYWSTRTVDQRNKHVEQALEVINSPPLIER
jgi:hypothetical protein